MSTRHLVSAERLTRVVQFSGGITSWAVARRVADRYGIDDLVLLFADTHIEDQDLYTFVESSAAQLGARLVRVADDARRGRCSRTNSDWATVFSRLARMR